MRSMWQILGAVIDGEINTKAQAIAILDEEAPQYADAEQITVEAARQQLKDNLGYASRYFTEADAEKIFNLFDTQHPVFGRQRPTPEEATRLSHEHLERMMKERNFANRTVQKSEMPPL